MDYINELFDRLDSWRHLPKFQLERHADIFFSFYLPEVLEENLGFKVSPTLIPEFPLKQEETNHSNNIDYFAVSSDGTKAILIELKTDMNSFREKQLKYLRDAQTNIHKNVKGVRFNVLLHDLLRILGTTKHRPKYYHLLKCLAKKDLLEIPENIKKHVQNKNFRDIMTASRGKELICKIDRCYVVFVLPRQLNSNQLADVKKYFPNYSKDDRPISFITFDEFGTVVLEQDDPFSKRFAQSLNEWTIQAGEMAPRK